MFHTIITVLILISFFNAESHLKLVTLGKVLQNDMKNKNVTKEYYKVTTKLTMESIP